MELVVVSQNGCNPCAMVKNFLADEGVEYREFNVSRDENVEIAGEKYTMDDLGIMGAPVTILFDEDGEEVARVTGFNPPHIQVLIDQL